MKRERRDKRERKCKRKKREKKLTHKALSNKGERGMKTGSWDPWDPGLGTLLVPALFSQPRAAEECPSWQQVRPLVQGSSGVPGVGSETGPACEHSLPSLGPPFWPSSLSGSSLCCRLGTKLLLSPTTCSLHSPVPCLELQRSLTQFLCSHPSPVRWLSLHSIRLCLYLRVKKKKMNPGFRLSSHGSIAQGQN